MICSHCNEANAELQMVRRMLTEQAKARQLTTLFPSGCSTHVCLLKQDARAHAKCVICDSTRSPSMPTRKQDPLCGCSVQACYGQYPTPEAYKSQLSCINGAEACVTHLRADGLHSGFVSNLSIGQFTGLLYAEAFGQSAPSQAAQAHQAGEGRAS